MIGCWLVENGIYFRFNFILKHFQNAQSEPWGKVGPGGMPWRNPRNVGDNFMNSMVSIFR